MHITVKKRIFVNREPKLIPHSANLTVYFFPRLTDFWMRRLKNGKIVWQGLIEREATISIPPPPPGRTYLFRFIDEEGWVYECDPIVKDGMIINAVLGPHYAGEKPKK